MKVQVWVRDLYGQGSIVKTCDDPKSAMDFAKKYVSDANFDNALTPVERQRNWELYLPIYDNDNIVKCLYSGKFANKHSFYSTIDNKNFNLDANHSCKLYLGEMSSSIYHVQDEKKREINSLDSDVLRNKGYVFFKVLL